MAERSALKWLSAARKRPRNRMKVLVGFILFCHAKYTYMSQTLWRGLYGPTRLGLRRIGVHVRHGRLRKRPSASESDRRRQGRRRGGREPRAAVHQSGSPRRDTRRPGARPAGRRRPVVRPPRPEPIELESI